MQTLITPIMMFKDVISQGRILIRCDDVPAKPIKRLVRLFGKVSDARLSGKVSYPLREILLIAFLAVLAGADSFVLMETFGTMKQKWLRRFIPLENGIPSHDTFRRVFTLIDPKHLESTTVAYLLENVKTLRRAFHIDAKGLRQYCVDGKSANGTRRLEGTPFEAKPLQTLHVYDCTDSICLASVAIKEKSNEIPAARDVLSAMDLRGVVVSWDALNSQLETVRAVVGQKGEYIAALKGNQPTLLNEAKAFFTPARLERIERDGKNFFETRGLEKNCVVTRKYYLSSNVPWSGDWPNLRSFVCCVRKSVHKVTGKTTGETAFHFTSLKDVGTCAAAIRGHWGVENGLHWQLDTLFMEDASFIADRKAFQNLSLMNKLALSLAKLASLVMGCSVLGARKSAGWDTDYVMKIICSFDEASLAAALSAVTAKKTTPNPTGVASSPT